MNGGGLYMMVVYVTNKWTIVKDYPYIYYYSGKVVNFSFISISFQLIQLLENYVSFQFWNIIFYKP